MPALGLHDGVDAFDFAQSADGQSVYVELEHGSDADSARALVTVDGANGCLELRLDGRNLDALITQLQALRGHVDRPPGSDGGR